MGSEIVTAIYRAKPGHEDTLAALVAEHTPMLQRVGLATDRAPIVMRSRVDGTIVEVFEWVDADAARRAHEHAEVGPMWGRMAKVADFLTLADLPEAVTPFAHFEPLP
ncbi:MAG: hypothetical protein O2894_01590 [Planctomycetota bacterium]|nr:hypothetical protein [Planctomycetota bacterium]